MNKKGFTLIELLIAITALGLIVVVLGASLRLAYRSTEKGQVRAERMERLQSSFMILQTQVQSLFQIFYYEDGVKKYKFEGGKDYMSFPSNYSIWGKGPVTVTYRVVAEQDGRKGLYAYEEMPFSLEDKGGREVRLFGGMDEISFDFHYEYFIEDKPEWFDSWEDHERIPQLVRLHIIEGGRETTMPIPVRASI
jgi:general secretion pathway protein J